MKPGNFVEITGILKAKLDNHNNRQVVVHCSTLYLAVLQEVYTCPKFKFESQTK